MHSFYLLLLFYIHKSILNYKEVLMHPMHSSPRKSRLLTLLSIFILLGSLIFIQASVRADHTPPPDFVTIAGSLQSELGCAGDWDPTCAATHLTLMPPMMFGRADLDDSKPETMNTRLP